LRYKENKQKCGRKPIQLPQDEIDYINEKVTEGWTPDAIIGRKERHISCGMKTLYRMFEKGVFNQEHLPMKGKRKPNGHQEKRGKQAFRRTINDRNEEHPNYEKEFGHLEGDTIVGKHHKSAVITLVERLSKCIITIKPDGRRASDVESSLNNWLHTLPRHTFKSIRVLLLCYTIYSGKILNSRARVLRNDYIEIVLVIRKRLTVLVFCVIQSLN